MPRIKYHQHFERRMEDVDNLSDEVTVVDVYDLASDIGKECERIIELYGADAVSSLIPKVVNTLELLENLAVKNGSENTQLLELNSKISQLENDKLERAECRQKFEKELEAIEEQWRAESKELMGLVSRLQEENRRLLKIQGTSQQVPVSPSPEIVGEGDVLQKLQTTLTKQREEIRSKDKMLHEKCCDIENMKSQIERLNGSSREFRRKHKSFQSQVRTLCDERADFLVQMQDQQRDIIVLRQRLGLAQKENEDLAKSDVSYPSNKAVYDLDDPNRPRFTTSELKDILHERNELKSRISDLEDELDTYRPKTKADTFIMSVPLNEKVNNILKSYNLILEELNPVDEDAPVQGPLPYEPDDAPWKRSSESGIRKFFRKIFSESSSGSSFPRRSLSTLTKMALSATDEPIPV